jgi:cephalosporin hydroxylase
MEPDVFKLEHAKIEELSKGIGVPFHRTLKQHENEVLPYLRAVAERLKGIMEHDVIRFMEIGVCYGGNFVLTGNSLEAFFPDVQVFGIGLDLPNIDRWGGHNIDPRQTVKQLGARFDHEIILGNSRDPKNIAKIAELLGPEKLDMLLIDGDHSKAGCEADWNNFKPFVKADGLIGIHDTKHYPNWRHVEVWKVWAELKKQYEHEEFSCNKNYGLGFVVNK